MDIKKELCTEISFIKGGKYRALVISDISDNFKTPTEISKSAKIPMRETSRALKELKELKEHDIVEVWDNKVRKGRVYQLTPKGLEVLEILNSNL